ncbi:MAG: HD domain-containing phosphohydrolase [Gallionellaceae bacterium]|jgi:putative nucleotidyltransferase with HDIG domain
MSDTKQNISAHYLQPTQLRVGVFVELDLPWFKHNFALSAFKIRSETQLQEVLNLRLPKYRYSPERSDLPDDNSPNNQIVVRELPAIEAVPESMLDDPVQAAEQQRIKMLAQREARINEVEKAFVKATLILKSLNKNLLLKPKETLDELGGLVGEMVTVFLESPNATLHVMGEKAGGEDVYYHSLNVSILAMMVAKDMELSAEVARELGIGAMLHDVGLVEVPDRISKKSPDEYTSAERNMRAMHVEYGIKIARKAGLSNDALTVVAQHHELADGSGYPNALKAAAMSQSARLVSLVNYYDNLCNPVDPSKALSPHDALSLMFAQRRSKFDARALAILIHSLGVYPPGTIVELSNTAVASVISVNPKRSLRPTVMVYDAKIPKERAIVINLEDEPEISITKSVRPETLPAKVLAYLNPRKRVTYFFDGDTQAGQE